MAVSLDKSIYSFLFIYFIPSLTSAHLLLQYSMSFNPCKYMCSFHINIEKTIGAMEEEMKAFPLVCVTPPLLLKGLGYQDPCLVFLSEGKTNKKYSKEINAFYKPVSFNVTEGK